MQWVKYFQAAETISKSVFVGMKFSSEGISWEALRVILAMKFGVLPSEFDHLPFPEMSEILAVLDGYNKAGGASDR